MQEPGGTDFMGEIFTGIMSLCPDPEVQRRKEMSRDPRVEV